MNTAIKSLRPVWLVDFKFHQPDGRPPEPICMAAEEWPGGRVVRFAADELRNTPAPPFQTDGSVLLVAYSVPAELSCFLALGWPMPTHVCDLFAEHRCQTNGRVLPSGDGLAGALICRGLVGVAPVGKAEMRELAKRGPPFSQEETGALLDYCAADVRALRLLWERMEPALTDHALQRGRYAKAVARMEATGIPVDVELLRRLQTACPSMRRRLALRHAGHTGVFGEDGSFSFAAFGKFLARLGIAWPRTPCGRLSVADETFEEMALTYPAVRPIKDVRKALASLRDFDLPVGPDGRARCSLCPFRSKTGRNQPSSSRFAFGLPAFLRGLIRPITGHSLAYIDYSQQEFGIAAALSGDSAMLQSYKTGDPYLAFAKLAGLAPEGATKQSHGAVREQCKAASLGVLYGMAAEGLAARLGLPIWATRRLLEQHRAAYPVFWEWSDRVVSHATFNGWIRSRLDWRLHVRADPNVRSLLNFPMQANGAEILRLACSYATEAGLQVCAPIHDALLIEAPTPDIQEAVRATQALMQRAGAELLDGFLLSTDASITTWPDRYADPRGAEMWATCMNLLEEYESAAAGTDAPAPPLS